VGEPSGLQLFPVRLQFTEPPVSSELPPNSTTPTGSQSPEPPSQVIGRLNKLRSGIAAVFGLPRSCLNAARAAYRADLERAVRAQLSVTPLRELRRFSEGQIRYGAIEAAGIRTVGAVMATSASRLESIRGVGSKSSARIRTAAKRLENEARRGLKVGELHRSVVDIADRPFWPIRRDHPWSSPTLAANAAEPSLLATTPTDGCGMWNCSVG